MKRIVPIVAVAVTISLSFPRRSTAQWVKTDSPEDRITALKVCGSNIFAVSEEGLFLSGDNGDSWTKANSGMEATTLKSLAVSGTTLFASSYDGVFLSRNNGKTWQITGSGPEDILCLAASKTHLFAGTYDGVFVSTDQGKSWKAARSELPKDPFCGSPCFIKKLVIRGTTLFALTGDFYEGESCGVYVSTDNGKKWKLLGSQFLGHPVVMDLTAKGPNLFIGSESGVFRSTDGGKTWREANSGLNVKEVYWGGKLQSVQAPNVAALEVTGTNLVAGTEEGAYLSADEGESWISLNSGLPEDTSVVCFAESGEFLFAGTSSAGVWRMPLSELSTAKR